MATWNSRGLRAVSYTHLDDGVAVAYILAIMDSPEIAHPRLEAVITVDEEIGMLGAEVIRCV